MEGYVCYGAEGVTSCDAPRGDVFYNAKKKCDYEKSCIDTLCLVALVKPEIVASPLSAVLALSHRI